MYILKVEGKCKKHGKFTRPIALTDNKEIAKGIKEYLHIYNDDDTEANIIIEYETEHSIEDFC